MVLGLMFRSCLFPITGYPCTPNQVSTASRVDGSNVCISTHATAYS